MLFLISLIILIVLLYNLRKDREGMNLSDINCEGKLVCKVSGYNYTHMPDLYDPEGNVMMPVYSTKDESTQTATLVYCGVLNSSGNNVLVVTSEGVQPYLHWLHSKGVERRLNVTKLGKSAQGKYIWLTS